MVAFVIDMQETKLWKENDEKKRKENDENVRNCFEDKKMFTLSL